MTKWLLAVLCILHLITDNDVDIAAVFLCGYAICIYIDDKFRRIDK